MHYGASTEESYPQSFTPLSVHGPLSLTLTLILFFILVGRQLHITYILGIYIHALLANLLITNHCSYLVIWLINTKKIQEKVGQSE